MTPPSLSFNEIAEEVKVLHDRDELLSKQRAKTKIEQRDVRLRIGALMVDVPRHLHDELSVRTGYTATRLREFERIRRAWPHGSFPADSTFTALEELAPDPNRLTLIKGGMTKRDAREARDGRKSDTPSRWTAEEKVKAMEEFSQDPAVARRAARSNVISNIARAEIDDVRQRREANPERKIVREVLDLEAMHRDLNSYRYGINRVTERAMSTDLSQTDRDMLKRDTEKIATALGWLQSWLDTGDASFEDSLQALLAEEEK